MSFFNYHMPPFLNVMGFFYILVAAPFIINLLRDGYWRGVFSQLVSNCKRHSLLILTVLVIVVGFIVWADLPLTIWVKEIDKSIHCYTFWDFICSCGEGGFIAGSIFTVMMLASYFKKDYLAEVCRISFMSSVYGGLANAVLKFLFNRQRPSIGLDQWHFFAFFRSDGGHVNDLLYAYNSMPSGHTISVVAAMIPFIYAYRQTSLRACFIIYPLLVAIARIYTINHWLSDVTVSTLFGFLVGISVYQTNSWRLKNG